MKKNLLLSIGVLILFSIAIFFATKKRKLTQPTKRDEIVSSEIASDYFDWQLSDTAEAQKLKELISVPLISLRKDLTIYHLITKIEEVGGNKLVSLRSSAYWSDKKALLAEHVVGTFERFKNHVGRKDFACRENKEGVCGNWAAKISMEVVNPAQFIVKGYQDEETFKELLASSYMRPIRPDLIGELQGWKVTLGAYTYPKDYAISNFKPIKITLDPNSNYYVKKIKDGKTIEF